jgi:hypothetical protein
LVGFGLFTLGFLGRKPPKANHFFQINKPFRWDGCESIYQKSTSLTLVSDDLKNGWENGWENAKSFLKVCGVQAYPRVSSKDIDEIKVQKFWQRVGQNAPQDQQKNRDNPRENHLSPSPILEQLDGVNLAALDRQATVTLLKLLHLGWKYYYHEFVSRPARLTYNQHQSDTHATNIWFDDLQSKLRPNCLTGTLIRQAPLGRLWVKTPDTPDWPLKLFPRLNFKEIDDRPEFKTWIIESGLVRTRPSEIHQSEWSSHVFPAIEELLSSVDAKNIKEVASVVRHTYRGLLECVETEFPHYAPIPRVCWYKGTLSLADGKEKAWAVFSDSERKEWQSDLPVFQFSQIDKERPNFKILGYRPLENHLTKRLIERPEQSEAIDVSEQVQQFAAWIYAVRCNELSNPPPLAKWKQLTATACTIIQIENSTDGFSRQSTAIHFHDPKMNRLFLTADRWKDPKTLARAFVDAFNIPPTLTDRLEILLGNSEQQRRARLLDDGMIESDLDEWLAKYRGKDVESEETAIIDPPVISEPIPAPIAPQEPNHPPAPTEPSNPKPAKDEAPAILHPAEVPPTFPEPVKPVAQTPEAPRPKTKRRAAGAQPATARSASNRSPRKPPKDFQDVEDRSREFVQQALEAQGYTVTQMEHYNPGYDIDARRGDEVLFVEVKGNKGQTSEVHLTPTELKTYKDAGNSYTWQLWHVSCLAEYSGVEPEIRIYEALPEHALAPEVYILNLAACQSVLYKTK